MQTQKARVIEEPSDDSNSEDYRPLDTIASRLPVEKKRLQRAKERAGRRHILNGRRLKDEKRRRNARMKILTDQYHGNHGTRTVARKKENWRRRARVREPEKLRGDVNLWTNGRGDD